MRAAQRKASRSHCSCGQLHPYSTSGPIATPCPLRSGLEPEAVVLSNDLPPHPPFMGKQLLPSQHLATLQLRSVLSLASPRSNPYFKNSLIWSHLLHGPLLTTRRLAFPLRPSPLPWAPGTPLYSLIPSIREGAPSHSSGAIPCGQDPGPIDFPANTPVTEKTELLQEKILK